ncbi:MAG: TAXI family TRAP transporter solute-binding subunit [Proteobacteria bacterium]|nr:TAXI family TRAP transporter solute-binding subunit [Pseudomonadota bacterium]
MKERTLLKAILGVSVLVTFTVLPLAVCAESAQPNPSGHEKVSINLLGGPFGVSSYIASFTLAELINKKSAWLRVTATESKGSPMNIKTLMADPKKKKTHAIMSSASVEYLARNGLPPFEAKYTTLKAISAYGAFAPTFITLDPSIKATGEDFLDKKIGLSAPLGADTVMARAIFEHGFGSPFKKFKVQYLGWGGVLDALADGTLDIGYIGVGQLGGDKFIATPALQKFMATAKKDIHWISFPPELITKARAGSGLPTYSVHVPAGALGPKQTEAYDGFADSVGWWADIEMDDEIPYEIARIIYEYHQEIWPAHKVLTYLVPATMGVMVSTEHYLHPGALKLYKQHGIRIGAK